MGLSCSRGSASISSCSTTLEHVDPGHSQATGRSFPQEQILPVPPLRVFNFQELKTATGNFNRDNLLGEGRFGRVYKGWLDDGLQPQRNGTGGRAVAIKKLNPEGAQGSREWQAEIDFLGRLSHPNLVKLLGYCFEDPERLLVYEFIHQGSLEIHLYGTGLPTLPWGRRIKIAMGVARGFDFLHTSDGRVIFRDMKAANVLLDEDYNAKISDFGLARLGPPCGQSHVTTRIIGTYGYVAPEYEATGHLYLKSDVYAFGVLLSELLTGLRAFDNRRPYGEQYLGKWIKPNLSSMRRLRTIMDKRLEGSYPPKAALKTAKLALSCLANKPKLRPSMKRALEALEEIQAIGEGET